MKKRLLLFYALIVVINSAFAQTWAWKNQVASSKSSSIEIYKDVAVDGWGNTYAVGYFDSTIIANGTNIYTRGSNDILVSKTNKDGQIIWIKAFGSKGDDKANSVTIDANGNPYITGYYTGKITFGATTLDSVNTMNQVFVTKLDTSGNAIWSSKVVSARNNAGIGIEYSHKSGLLVVAGKMGGTMTFDGGITLTGSGADNIFIGKIDTLGVWVNATKIQSGATFTIGGMDIDANENIYVSFSTSMQMLLQINAYKADGTTVSSNLSSGITLTPQTPGLVFIARIAADYSSASRWVYQTYQTNVYPNGLTVGVDNNPLFIFNYRAYQGQASYQVRKLSNDLTTNNAIWARNIGAPSGLIVGGIVVDKDTTTSVLLGNTGGSLENTGASITLSTGFNMYMARINSKGQWLSNPAIVANGANWQPDALGNSGGLAIDTANKELRAGINLGFQNFTAGVFNLEPKSPLAQSKYDAFVLKFGCVDAGFFKQPNDSLVCPSGTLYAKVVATGSNLTYTWKKNNVTIGTNSAIYSKASAIAADSGFFKVDIRSVCFKDTTYATSNTIKLGFIPAPVFALHPIGDTVCIGNVIKLKAKAIGKGITYSWNYTSCINCVLSTTDSLNINATSLYNAKTYYAIATDICMRKINSNNAPIVLESVIAGNTLTTNTTICEQGVIRITSGATSTGYYEIGTSNLTYTPKLKFAWKKDGNLINTTSDKTYIKSNIETNDGGNYTAEVSNNACAVSVSAPVSISVTPTTDFNSETNLKLFMPFNGTFEDESGISNFTTTSTATFTNDRNTTPNTAANFSSALLSNQIRIPDSTFVKSTVGTLSFWFKTSTANQVLFGTQNKALGTSPNVAIINAYIDYNGLFRGALYTGSTFTTSAIKNNFSKVIVNDNQWHNVVIAYNSNTQSIYIDGSLQYTINATIATKATVSFADYPLSITQFGATSASGPSSYTNLNTSNVPYFVGQLDDISIHTNAFDACDASRLYSLGVKINVLGIENTHLNNTSKYVYPNPSNGSFYVDVTELGESNLLVYDINGQLVLSLSGLNNVQTIESTLKSGLYFVQIQSPNKTINSKIIIE